MEVQWNDHNLKVSGDWSFRWLFLAPDYELWLDGELLDRQSGPRLRPRLEAVYEDEQGKRHHIEAELLSVIGFRPHCELSVEGKLLASDNVRVQNFLNPFLVLFILAAVAVMFYVGPDVIEHYVPF